MGSIGSYRLSRVQRWLNPLLIVGVFVYLFSPLADHWLGHGGNVRPHNHVVVAELNLIDYGHPGNEQLVNPDSEEGHEASVICLLDFNLLFVAILLVAISLSQLSLPRFPFSFSLLFPQLMVVGVELPGLYRPPRF